MSEKEKPDAVNAPLPAGSKPAPAGPIDHASAEADKAAAVKAEADKAAAAIEADKAKASAVAAAEKAERLAQQEAHANRVKALEAELKAAREAQVVATQPRITGFAGIVRGPFVINGENLGAHLEVRINNRLVIPSSVKADKVKGTVPSDVKTGKVTVQVGTVTFDGAVSA